MMLFVNYIFELLCRIHCSTMMNANAIIDVVNWRLKFALDCDKEFNNWIL